MEENFIHLRSNRRTHQQGQRRPLDYRHQSLQRKIAAPTVEQTKQFKQTWNTAKRTSPTHAWMNERTAREYYAAASQRHGMV